MLASLQYPASARPAFGRLFPILYPQLSSPLDVCAVRARVFQQPASDGLRRSDRRSHRHTISGPHGDTVDSHCDPDGPADSHRDPAPRPYRDADTYRDAHTHAYSDTRPVADRRSDQYSHAPTHRNSYPHAHAAADCNASAYLNADARAHTYPAPHCYQHPDASSHGDSDPSPYANPNSDAHPYAEAYPHAYAEAPSQAHSDPRPGHRAGEAGLPQQALRDLPHYFGAARSRRDAGSEADPHRECGGDEDPRPVRRGLHKAVHIGSAGVLCSGLRRGGHDGGATVVQ